MEIDSQLTPDSFNLPATAIFVSSADLDRSLPPVDPSPDTLTLDAPIATSTLDPPGDNNGMEELLTEEIPVQSQKLPANSPSRSPTPSPPINEGSLVVSHEVAELMEVDEASLAVEGNDQVSSACDVEERWYRVVTTFPDPQYTISRAMEHLWPALELHISQRLVAGFATSRKPTDQFDEVFFRLKDTMETDELVEKIKRLMPAPFRRFDMTPVMSPTDGLEVLTLAGLIAYYDLCLNPETAARHYAQMQLLASDVASTSHRHPAPHNKVSGASAVKAKRSQDKAVNTAKNSRRRELSKLTKSLHNAFDLQGPDRDKQVAEIKKEICAAREKWGEKLKELQCPAREVFSISKELESLLNRAL
jgi:hypothetical protein